MKILVVAPSWIGDTVLAQPLLLKHDAEAKWLPLFTAVAAVVCLALSRWVFYRALRSYRSASS